MENVASQIVRRLRDAGYEALFAGGCVRDKLRHKEPKDFDIATSATPDEILTLFPEGDTIGAHFGVILVKEGGFHFEVATFREDGDYQDGRRPESVRFSNAQNDAKRRDFTINGMFYDPLEDTTIDYVKGQEDLEKGVIRAIGEPGVRFEEDFLRMLRAIRFATRFGFEIEPLTWQAIQSTASSIQKISPERIRGELDQIWTDPQRVRGFDLLVESGLMAVILPEILDLQGCEQPPQWHPEGDVFVHTRLMLSLLEPDASLPLVLSVLFHDIAKPATYQYDEEAQRIRFNGHDRVGAEMTEQILKRLRYSNAVIDAVVSGVKHHMMFACVKKMKRSKLRRFMSRDYFETELELHRVDCSGSNGNLENYEFLKEKELEFANEPILPAPFLRGKDLLELGWKAGPAFGRTLRKAMDLQLEGTLTDREMALEWLRQKTP